MLKFTAKDREQLAEFRQGWLCIVIFAVLLVSHEIADTLLGRGWAVFVAALAGILWIFIRPWRFGLLTPHTRRSIRLLGFFCLAAFALVSLLRYWRG
jgi:peptidoglycan biosynthesis protein MviN/MurJ (putative lipid II flippase)